MAKIFVIAGHGAGDSGAVGNGYTEAERVRALASKIKDLGGNNVMLGDFSRNYYADNGITKLNISKDYKIVELHMDSASSSARGGHVIIKSGYNADSYDIALAKSISAILPGRASSIVKRSDLANPNRAAAKGYNYRLIENGFITNAQDVKIFNNRMDEIAREILNDFGIKTAASISEPIDGNVVAGGVSQNGKNTFGTVSYCGHLRGTGWAAWQCDGAMIGSTGQNRRIEAIKLDCDDSPDVVVHLKDIGDKEYKSVSKDTIIGTTGENRRIEAIKITGKKRFYMYRVHQKDLGWSSWANNGEWAGVRGQGKQVEAIEIKESMFSVNPHVQNDGFIDDNKNIFGLRWLCHQFGISPNCYYNYKKDAKCEYHRRLAHIFELIKYVYYNNNRVIGYRAMRIFIKRYGYIVSNTTMHKYMNKELHLYAVIMHSKPGYKTGKKHKIFDNLLNQNFTVDGKNKVWCTDFTYMRQPNGKFRYNCSIIDLYDRSAVASVNSNYINTELAIDTLKKALEQEHYPQVILHSDQGVQFTSWEFVNFCKDNNVTQSMSKAGCPYDNAPMERFYNTFKSNFYNVTSFSSIEMMDELTIKYINWYNYVRPHSYNNYLTPMEARYS